MTQQLDTWQEKLQQDETGREITESLSHYEQSIRVHNDNIARIQNSVFQVLQRGQELFQVSFLSLTGWGLVRVEAIISLFTPI